MSPTPQNRKPTIFTATVHELGRITIPDELRTLHELVVDDLVELKMRSVQEPRTFLAKIINFGMVTIPKELRLAHSVEKDDILEFEILSVQKNPKETKK